MTSRAILTKRVSPGKYSKLNLKNKARILYRSSPEIVFCYGAYSELTPFHLSLPLRFSFVVGGCSYCKLSIKRHGAHFIFPVKGAALVSTTGKTLRGI